MVKGRRSGRRLRSLWATLAVVCLVGAGAAYGMIRFQQSELEFDATTHARDLSQDVIGPKLEPADLEAPANGARYEEILDLVDRRVLTGPIAEVRIWGLDGTILWADDRSLVGERYPTAVELQPAISGATRSEVDGDRFRTFTWTRVGKLRELLVVEIVRSHSGFAQESEQRWSPWVVRGLIGAAFFGILWIVTAGAFALVPGLRRREQPAVAKPTSAPEFRVAWDPSMPEYMRPGYRQEFEARRRMLEEVAVREQLEQDIVEVRHQRDDLIARLRRAEAEREAAEAQTSVNA